MNEVIGVGLELLDLRVLGFGEAVASAVTGHRLAMLGADVVIAEPAEGCWLRQVPWSQAATNPLWSAWGAGARSAPLDDVAALVLAADVVLATQATAQRLGLLTQTWDTQLLVILDDQEGHGELRTQAAAGLLSYLGDLNGAPVRAGFEVVGWATGVVACHAVLAAAATGYLTRSGIVRVDVLRVAATLLSNQIISHSDPDAAIGFAAYQHQPPEHGFRAADGWVEIIFHRDDGGFQRFCAELGCPQWADDPRFSSYPRRTNCKAELADVLQPYLAAHLTADVERLVLAQGGLAATRVTVEAAATGAQSRANGLSCGTKLGEPDESIDGSGPWPRSLHSPWMVNGRRSSAEPTPERWQHATAVASAWAEGAQPRARLAPLGAPLDGQVIVDVTEGAQGPFAVSLLADLGAAVIKVERPGGEFMRRVGPFRKGEALPFLALNHGRAVAAEIDLGDRDERVYVQALARHADLFVENWRHGTADRLGLGPSELRAANSQLVYVAASGFGSQGPLAAAGALDQISQAASGMWSLSGPEGGTPERFRGALLDYLSALVTAEAALIGLIERHRTGRGALVEVSQLGSALSVCQPELLLPEADTAPQGTRSRFFAPSATYATGDGRWLVVEAQDEEQWEALRARLDAPELDDARFATNRLRVEHGDALHRVLIGHLAAGPARRWLGEGAVGIAEVVRPLGAQLVAGGALRRSGHVVDQWCRVGPVLRVPPPWALPVGGPPLAPVGPSLGAQTAVLRWLLQPELHR